MALNSTRINKIGNDASVPAPAIALGSHTECCFKEDALLEQLQQYFSEPEARRQLDTAIDWGRFAELFAYDDDTGELYLEEDEEDPQASRAAAGG